MTTVGGQMQRAGVRTAMIGKYDAGYSSWACTPTCRGFDYFLGYYGAAEDYYLHGGAKTLDFHENDVQAPQYRGQYSTNLFTQKAISWIQNETAAVPGGSTYLHLAYQAVHGPIEAPPTGNDPGCSHIQESTRAIYCAMIRAVDSGIANLTATYRKLGLFDETVWLFLSDNGGTNQDGGFNVPLRGQKATVWEGGVRSQTFVHWSGFSARLRGSVWTGLAHAADWGVTLVAALGHNATGDVGLPLDGVNLWPALTTGGHSPRTEMLLSLRDAGQCGIGFEGICTHPGQLAYRKGPWKLIYGHPPLRGGQGDDCSWAGHKLNCWNGWGRPKDIGPSRPPPTLPLRPGQPPNTSIYQWGGVFLFNIEDDPLEEHEMSVQQPELVQQLLLALLKFNESHINQDVMHESNVKDTESCGSGLACAVPWLPGAPHDKCQFAPLPPPSPPSPNPPPNPPPRPGYPYRSHLTDSANWIVSHKSISVRGWVCFTGDLPRVSLRLDQNTAVDISLQPTGSKSGATPCITGGATARFNHTFNSISGMDSGNHTVAGFVNGAALGNSPGCIANGHAVHCN